MTGLGPLELIKLAIFYASYLYFPAALLFGWWIVRTRGPTRFLAAACLMISSCLAYGRFVEPRLLFTAEHDVALRTCYASGGDVRIAVVSDMHVGLFANAMPVQRIARRLDAANADLVLVAGDFIYFLHPDRLEETFAPLGVMRAPVFAVLGNHDIGLPGPDLGDPLRVALPKAGVTLIDNTAIALSDNGFSIELVGLSDHWGRAQDLTLLQRLHSVPLLVLTHNPSAAQDFHKNMSADLLIGGHTHGGQIQLPFVTCRLTGVCGDTGYGLREARGLPIFTTSGTGMVGLPMRFRVPPRIDLLNVRYKACSGG